MAEDDAQVAGPHEPGGGHIVQVLLLGHFPSHHTGEGGDEEDAKDNGDLVLTHADDSDEHQGQQDAGKSGDGVAHPHEDQVGRAAEVAGETADDGADDPADEHHAQGNEEGAACALHNSGEQFAPEVVGSQGMAQAGRHKLLPAGHLRGSVGSPDEPHQNERRHKGGNNGAADEEVVGAVPALQGPSLPAVFPSDDVHLPSLPSAR